MNKNMRIGAARPTWYLACLSLLFAGLLTLTSCKKEYFEPDRIKDSTWNPELAVPLIKSTVTVPEVLGRLEDQDVIVIDTTGILALRYFDNIFSLAAEDVVVLLTQSNAQTAPLLPAEAVTLAGGGTVALGPVTFDFPLNWNNLPDAPELQSITFKGGSLDFSITSTYTYPVTLNLTIPGLTPSPGTMTVMTNTPFSLPLAGRTMNLTTGAQGFNDIRLTASGSISGASGTGMVGQTMTLTSTITNPAFSLILGDIKQQNFNPPASEVRIRFFENQQDGIITWNDPRVKAIFTNGIGANVNLQFAQMDFQPPGAAPIRLTSTFFPAPLYNALINGSSTVGVQVPTTIDLNRNTSNIVTVAASGPTKLFYQVNGSTNPQGGSNVNWLQDTSKIKLDMEVFLPFDGTAVDFSKADTAKVEIFPIDGDIQEIESVTFRLTIDNGFPVDAHGQVYFYDSTLTDSNFTGIPVPIDSLFPNAPGVVFASPVPNAQGRVDQSQKVRTVLDITVDRDKLKKLEAAKFTNLVSKGWIDTYNRGAAPVQIYDNYTMDLYLGVIVKIKYKVEL